MPCESRASDMHPDAGASRATSSGEEDMRREMPSVARQCVDLLPHSQKLISAPQVSQVGYCSSRDNAESATINHSRICDFIVYSFMRAHTHARARAQQKQ